MDLITLGEFLIDLFPAETGKRLAEVSAFTPKPGGAPANVAVAAARLGASTAFIGKVGADFFGEYLREVLEREKVDTRGLMMDPDARTTLAFIAQPDHNNEYSFYRNPGADQRLRPDELDRALLTSTRALHFGSISLTDEPARSATLEAVRIAREKNALSRSTSITVRRSGAHPTRRSRKSPRCCRKPIYSRSMSRKQNC